MSHFGNMNLRVQKHKEGTVKDVSEFHKKSLGVLQYERENNRVLEESAKVNQESINKKLIDEIDKEQSYYKFNTVNREKALFECLSKQSAIGKGEVFKQIVFEAFMGSLVLDKEFKIQQYATLESYCKDYIESKGGWNFLLEACKKNPNSKLLKNIKNVSEKTSSKVCKEKLKSCKEQDSESEFLFDLTEEEKEELRFNADLGIDELSDIVKDKVKNVLIDEKERGAVEEEILNELESEEVEESYVYKHSGVKEATLFNSLMQKTYKELLESCTEESSVDMDLVLGESVTKYTLYEVLNTYKLEDFPLNRVKQMSLDNMYK